LTPNLIVELGLFKDFSKTPVEGFAGTFYRSLWSPRFGLNYQFKVGQTQHALRLALFRALVTHFTFQPLLVSSEVAGFPWPIDAHPGSEIRQVGGAWEAQWDAKTFTTLRLDALRISTPSFEVITPFPVDLVNVNPIAQTWKRYQASLTLNRILLPSLGLTLGVRGKRFLPDLSLAPLMDFSEIDYTLGLAYLRRDGWLAGARTILVQQFLKDRADNLFGLVNLRVGRELPNKRGLATFEVENLFNRHFIYPLEPLRDPEFFPSRSYIFRLALYF
jgi:hypothetical protein